MPVEGTPRANDSARGVSARSVTSRRRTSHLDSPEQTAFTEVASEPWPTEASQPYICRHVDSEDSEIGKEIPCRLDLQLCSLMLSHLLL